MPEARHLDVHRGHAGTDQRIAQSARLGDGDDEVGAAMQQVDRDVGGVHPGERAGGAGAGGEGGPGGGGVGGVGADQAEAFAGAAEGDEAGVGLAGAVDGADQVGSGGRRQGEVGAELQQVGP